MFQSLNEGALIADFYRQDNRINGRIPTLSRLIKLSGKRGDRKKSTLLPIQLYIGRSFLHTHTNAMVHRRYITVETQVFPVHLTRMII